MRDYNLSTRNDEKTSFFPFVGGESVEKNRKEYNTAIKKEMNKVYKHILLCKYIIQ